MSIVPLSGSLLFNILLYIILVMIQVNLALPFIVISLSKTPYIIYFVLIALLCSRRHVT